MTPTLTIRLPPNCADPSGKPPHHISDIAYKQGFKYLVSLLVQLRDASHHQELNARSYEQLQQGLEVSWDSYSCKMWLYTTYAGQDVLTWWTEMMLHEASFVLAVCCSTFIKSMHSAKVLHSFLLQLFSPSPQTQWQRNVQYLQLHGSTQHCRTAWWLRLSLIGSRYDSTMGLTKRCRSHYTSCFAFAYLSGIQVHWQQVQNHPVLCYAELKKSRPVDWLTAKPAITLAEANEAEILGPPGQSDSDSDSEARDIPAWSFNLHTLEEALSEININSTYLEDILSNDSPKPFGSALSQKVGVNISLNPNTSKVAQKPGNNAWRVFTPL